MSTRTVQPGKAPAVASAPVERRRTRPVAVFAVTGALIIAFEVFVYTRWITGPRFERVNSGPDSPPDWMKFVLNAGQVASVLAGLGCLYWFVYRPYRRDRRLSVDGLFALSFLVLSFQDPISSYFGHWFTYNTYMFNRGSFVNDIPGWNAFGQPGQMLATPIFFIIPAYVWAISAMIFAGRRILIAAAGRWPRLGTLGQIGVCLVGMCGFGLVMEATVLMPLGFYEYPGGPMAAVNGGHYYKYPIFEAVIFALLSTSFACLRHFTNDRGETLGEMGVSRLPFTGRRQTAVRFLAITGAINICMLVTYNLPASWMGTHSDAWPQDFQDRSYFTGHLCGPGTDRACPGPTVPIPRPDSSYVSPSGQLVNR
jgi:hypothetical protein